LNRAVSTPGKCARSFDRARRRPDGVAEKADVGSASSRQEREAMLLFDGNLATPLRGVVFVERLA
jgi:hypothetical protein